jgi:hypothetical protein
MVATATLAVAGVALAGGAAFATTALPAQDETDSISVVDSVTPVAVTEETDADLAPDEESDAAPGSESATATKGNARSQEVATVPREAAKMASTVKGNETGKLISEWAKTHANKKSDAQKTHEKVADDAATPNDAEAESESESEAADEAEADDEAAADAAESDDSAAEAPQHDRGNGEHKNKGD